MKIKTYDLSASEIIPKKNLDSYYSDKRLGAFIEDGRIYFRVFAPSARKVVLIVFKQPEDEFGKEYSMNRDSNCVWEYSLENTSECLFYGYKVTNEHLKEDSQTICIDPYAKNVATFNTYMNPRRAIFIKDEKYNWDDDEWIQNDWRDLIIYEMHIKDLTAHPSAEIKNHSSYKALIEKSTNGGIDYIKALGVNAIELLPVQEFGCVEIPYKKHFVGKYNTWNPSERNYWGYMTASYFAPSAYYAEDWKEFKWEVWMGKEAKAARQFKDLVKAFHKENIAVVMDVVFNHLSEYETGNLKEIDAQYYFRYDKNKAFKSESGCGNDLKTERPMVRRMVIDSILYWMKEYHIDGFRFDLGKLIDWETLEEISYKAKRLNPSVILIAEPWGGGYDPQGFSARGFASWNDKFRDAIKGENPHHEQGWIFGKWSHHNNYKKIVNYFNGTITKEKYGLFIKAEHSVNYCESHDGYTLGDFIRIATKEEKTDGKEKFPQIDGALSPIQLKINKLASIALLTSRGIIMIHEGQEFARSKTIDGYKEGKDSSKEIYEHNSYNKDDATNYLNFNHAKLNKELIDYYKGLINLRKNNPAFRRAEYKNVNYLEVKNKPFAIGLALKYEETEFLVLLNAENKSEVRFDLPDGRWDILVNPEQAGAESLGKIEKTITLQPKDGYVLKLDKTTTESRIN